MRRKIKKSCGVIRKEKTHKMFMKLGECKISDICKCAIWYVHSKKYNLLSNLVKQRLHPTIFTSKSR